MLRTLNKNINHSECNIFIGKTLFPIFISRNDSIFLKQLNEMGPFTSLEMPIHLKLIHTVQQYWQAKVYPLNKQSSDGKQEVKYSDFQLQILSFIAKLPTIWPMMTKTINQVDKERDKSRLLPGIAWSLLSLYIP